MSTEDWVDPERTVVGFGGARRGKRRIKHAVPGWKVYVAPEMAEHVEPAPALPEDPGLFAHRVDQASQRHTAEHVAQLAAQRRAKAGWAVALPHLEAACRPEGDAATAAHMQRASLWIAHGLRPWKRAKARRPQQAYWAVGPDRPFQSMHALVRAIKRARNEAPKLGTNATPYRQPPVRAVQWNLMERVFSRMCDELTRPAPEPIEGPRVPMAPWRAAVPEGAGSLVFMWIGAQLARPHLWERGVYGANAMSQMFSPPGFGSRGGQMREGGSRSLDPLALRDGVLQ